MQIKFNEEQDQRKLYIPKKMPSAHAVKVAEQDKLLKAQTKYKTRKNLH